jgi:hypothetical protein
MGLVLGSRASRRGEATMVRTTLEPRLDEPTDVTPRGAI